MASNPSDAQYLLDTNIISELRKRDRANAGVQQFLQDAIAQEARLYLSAITIGELRRGVELIRQRDGKPQAELLEVWLNKILEEYEDYILDFSATEAQVWGRLMVPNPHNVLDKQLAATALVYGLILVTRNTRDFEGTGVALLNPFEE